eukprot:2896273-Amphidinium_carterae.1
MISATSKAWQLNERHQCHCVDSEQKSLPELKQLQSSASGSSFIRFIARMVMKGPSKVLTRQYVLNCVPTSECDH